MNLSDLVRRAAIAAVAWAGLTTSLVTRALDCQSNSIDSATGTFAAPATFDPLPSCHTCQKLKPMRSLAIALSRVNSPPP